VPGVLGVLSVAAFVVVDLGGLILTAWGPQPGSGWLKANLAVSVALLAVTVATLVLGLSVPGIRRAAIVAAWLVIPVGWVFFLITCQLARKAG
jgi:purine-cytosine permease-like protein